MKVAANPDDYPERGAVISIGNFDGVHWGHRQLLSRMSALAEELARPAAVVTFFPPARTVFTGSPFLCSQAEKLALLEAFDPHAVIVIPFTDEYSKTDKRVFISQMARLEPAAIVVGEDFRFGHNREGSLQDLAAITERLEVVPLQELDGEVVKSTRIRELLQAGAIEDANRLLSAPYRACGTVVKGERRGTELGFPTANLSYPQGKCIPNGVFATVATVGGKSYPGVANAGPRPTYPDNPPALEVHLLDFDGDLYGQELCLQFIARIRTQKRFASVDELRGQLASDVKLARELLAGA